MTFGDILGKFGTAELGAVLGIDESHVRTIKARGSVPPEYWPALVENARGRGFPDLTIDDLLEMRRAKFVSRKAERPTPTESERLTPADSGVGA